MGLPRLCLQHIPTKKGKNPSLPGFSLRARRSCGAPSSRAHGGRFGPGASSLQSMIPLPQLQSAEKKNIKSLCVMYMDVLGHSASVRWLRVPVRPQPKVIKMNSVPPYGLKESPKMWEHHWHQKPPPCNGV
eukprot:385320-Amphidinium_carterae.1